MSSIEEIINIPILKERFEEAIKRGSRDKILHEIILQRTFRTPLEPLDSILVVFQNYMSYKRNSQQIQWLMRVGAGCALQSKVEFNYEEMDVDEDEDDTDAVNNGE
jgi:hypothetical protein